MSIRPALFTALSLPLAFSIMVAAAPVAAKLLLDGEELTVMDTGNLPARGMSMRTVVERHGEPSRMEPAVGDPPITRWDYADFSVFFEHRHVIHSVVHPRSPNADH